jgi:hypothetical protein
MGELDQWSDGRQDLIGRGDIGHGTQARCGEYLRYQYTRIKGSMESWQFAVSIQTRMVPRRRSLYQHKRCTGSGLAGVLQLESKKASIKRGTRGRMEKGDGWWKERRVFQFDIYKLM